LVQRGLRVRMGLHSGVEADECTHNATTGRRAYGGVAMKAAKAVSDAAAGGMVSGVALDLYSTETLATGQ
jgi:hypothetical protein